MSEQTSPALLNGSFHYKLTFLIKPAVAQSQWLTLFTMKHVSMLLTLMMLAVFSQCDRADSDCTFTWENKWNISPFNVTLLKPPVTDEYLITLKHCNTGQLPGRSVSLSWTPWWTSPCCGPLLNTKQSLPCMFSPCCLASSCCCRCCSPQRCGCVYRTCPYRNDDENPIYCAALIYMNAKYDEGYHDWFTFKGTHAEPELIFEPVASPSTFPDWRFLPLNLGCVEWLAYSNDFLNRQA